MAILDWFKRPAEVSYNSAYEPSTTISGDGYAKEFPTSYYYAGYLLNSSSLYTIQVIILKNDGYTIGPLTMEPITKLTLSGIDIKQLVVIQPKGLNSGTTTGATFRYDMIGTTQSPLPGYQLIDIAPYLKTVNTSNVFSISGGGSITESVYTLYTVPDGYKFIIHDALVILAALSTTGTRQSQILTASQIGDGSSWWGLAVLADTGPQTGIHQFWGGTGSAAGEDISQSSPGGSGTNKYISWGSEQTLMQKDKILVQSTLQSGDLVNFWQIDGELVQI